MKTLLLLRHAKADHPAGVADHERPLKGRGRSDADRLGARLREESLVPQRISSSTALRARETAIRVAEAAGCSVAVELTEELYQAAPGDVLRVLAGLYGDDDRVLVVGHNPTFEELLERLIGHYEHMPTAALAHVRLPIQVWMELDSASCGELVALWRPKELDESS